MKANWKHSQTGDAINRLKRIQEKKIWIIKVLRGVITNFHVGGTHRKIFLKVRKSTIWTFAQNKVRYTGYFAGKSSSKMFYHQISFKPQQWIVSVCFKMFNIEWSVMESLVKTSVPSCHTFAVCHNISVIMKHNQWRLSKTSFFVHKSALYCGQINAIVIAPLLKSQMQITA